GGRGEEDLETGFREDHRAHVAPVGHQARGLRELFLALQQCITHRRPHGHPRGALPGLLGADGQADVLTGLPQQYALVALGILAEAHLHGGGNTGMSGRIIGGQAGALAGQRHQAVQRTAVEQVPAQACGDTATDGALAGAGGPVDGDDRGAAHASAMCRPAAPAVAVKPGKDVATFSTSRMVKGASASRLATAKDMAMRWSLWLSMVAARSRWPPSMRMPSGRNSLGTPTRVRPSAITARRSLSFTRNSAAPVNSVSPSAPAAAMNSTGSSSMASGTSSGGTAMPFSEERRS